MKIENMDKSKAIMLSNELMAAAEAIASKYGLEVKRGSGKYDSQEYKLNSVVFFVPSGSGSGMIPSKENKLVRDWNMNRGGYGLNDVNVGDEFQNRDGHEIKLIGWDSKKRKYPIIYENLVKGGQYKTTPLSFKVMVRG
jgi:hypothetical protein